MSEITNKVSNLLSVVERESLVKEARREERRRHGESFNIFQILNATENETSTHSALIATLLNPKADHGCGSAFLRCFLQDFFPDKAFSEDELQHADVQVEFNIGNKTEDETEGGRIDITINVGRWLLIIENKIYANDQYKQLLRYRNYAQGMKGSGRIEDFSIVYLTLYGDAASDSSTGGEMRAGKDYTTLSYAKDIIRWLEQCEMQAIDKAPVREIIMQYEKTIKQLTNQTMDKKEKEVLFKAMASYPSAVAEVYRNFGEFNNYVFQNVCVPQLRKVAEDRGMEFKLGDDIGRFEFRRPEWNYFVISFTWDTETYKWSYYGVKLSQPDAFYSGPGKDFTNRPALFEDASEAIRYEWPFGNEWAVNESGTYHSWADGSLLEPMLNEAYAAYVAKVVDEILGKLESNNIQLI